jgi:hypothetical protein
VHDAQVHGQSTVSLEIMRQARNHVVLAYANLLLLLWRGAQDAETCATVYDLAAPELAQSGMAKASRGDYAVAIGTSE